VVNIYFFLGRGFEDSNIIKTENKVVFVGYRAIPWKLPVATKKIELESVQQ
jgi:hypothetical protein